MGLCVQKWVSMVQNPLFTHFQTHFGRLTKTHSKPNLKGVEIVVCKWPWGMPWPSVTQAARILNLEIRLKISQPSSSLHTRVEQHIVMEWWAELNQALWRRKPDATQISLSKADQQWKQVVHARSLVTFESLCYMRGRVVFWSLLSQIELAHIYRAVDGLYFYVVRSTLRPLKWPHTGCSPVHKVISKQRSSKTVPWIRNLDPFCQFFLSHKSIWWHWRWIPSNAIVGQERPTR